MNVKATLVILLACGVVPATATLEVDFVTTRGTITAVMEYVKTPKAVANLLTLAQGTRNWVDPLTGQVRNTLFFNGLAFCQVVNNGTEKTIETGSPTGSGADDPGYGFPDEFDASLTHVPYVMSMSNSGPNTNGARFCFTGNLALSARDGRNTVFGKVLSAASRSVIDSILAAGANATTITAVQVRRTDPAASAFDASAVALPAVQTVAAPLHVLPGVAVAWLGVQPADSVLQAFQSTNLAEWFPHYRHMVGLDDALPGASQRIDTADVPARFYWFSLVTCPAATGVTGFANRTLTVDSPGTGTLIYQFDGTGTGGTYQNIVFPGDPPFYSGTFLVRDEIPASFEPYSFRVLVYANGLGGAPFNLISGGLDAVGPTAVSGHQVIRLLSAAMTLVFEDSGALLLSRP